MSSGRGDSPGLVPSAVLVRSGLSFLQGDLHAVRFDGAHFDAFRVANVFWKQRETPPPELDQDGIDAHFECVQREEVEIAASASQCHECSLRIYGFDLECLRYTADRDQGLALDLDNGAARDGEKPQQTRDRHGQQTPAPLLDEPMQPRGSLGVCGRGAREESANLIADFLRSIESSELSGFGLALCC